MREENRIGGFLRDKTLAFLTGGLLLLAGCGKGLPPPEKKAKKDPAARKRSRVEQPPPPPPAPPSPPPPEVHHKPSVSVIVRTEPPSDAAPPPNPSDPSGEKEFFQHNVMLVNVAGIVADTLRRRGLVQEQARVQALMAQYERRLQESRDRMMARGESMSLPDRLRPGDRIVAIGNKDLPPGPAEAAAILQDWPRRLEAGLLERCVVERGGEKVQVMMYFGGVTPQMRALLRAAEGGAALPAEAPVAPAPATDLALPDDLVRWIQGEFEALPPGYRRAVPPEERRRMEALLASRRGWSEDLEFLRTRILGDLLPRFRAEAARARARMQDLEPVVMQAMPDVVHFKNGARIEAKVEEETAEKVRYASWFGAVQRPRSEVLRIERGKGSSIEFPLRCGTALGKPEELRALADWCREKGLGLHREYACWLLLGLDASDERARAELGLGSP